MENLRFGKEDYFHVLVFYAGYFQYKRNRKYFHCVPTRESLGELEIAWISISRPPKFPMSVFITVWKH